MLVTAFEAPLEWPAKLLLALNGIISGAFGAVMFIEPDVGAVAIVALIAAYIIVIGVMQVGFALELRQLLADARDRFPRPTATAPACFSPGRACSRIGARSRDSTRNMS